MMVVGVILLSVGLTAIVLWFHSRQQEIDRYLGAIERLCGFGSRDVLERQDTMSLRERLRTLAQAMENLGITTLVVEPKVVPKRVKSDEYGDQDPLPTRYERFK